MKLKKFKTLDYENFRTDAKKCLSPVIKKISKYNISTNIEKIKNMFKSYDSIILNNKIKTDELAKENKFFQNNLNKYRIYRQFLAKHHKDYNKNHLNVINNLKMEYFKKGYKIPNFNNLFKRSPLNYKGVPIKQYFNELYKKEKKEISRKEKNIDFLIRLDNYIKDLRLEKNSEMKNIIKSANISPKKSSISIKEKFKNFVSPENKLNIRKKKSSLLHTNINSEEKSGGSSKNKRSIKKRNKSKSIYSDIDIGKSSNEEEEDFKELNEYERKRIIQLTQEEEEVKAYNQFVEKAISDNNFFDVIDYNDLDLNKIKEKKQEQKKRQEHNNNIIKNININANKMKSSSSIKHFIGKTKINNDKSEESSLSSETPKKSNMYNEELCQKESKKSLESRKNTNRINININNINNINVNKIDSRNNKKFQLRKSLTLKNIIEEKTKNNLKILVNNIANINKKQFLTLKSSKNDIKNKRFSFSINSIPTFLKIINEEGISNENGSNKLKANKLKENNILKYRDVNKMNNYNNNKKERFLTKQESLNYLFKKLVSGKVLDDEYIKEYKRYFIKNKNISEHSLNQFINKKYDINDFVILFNSIDNKIKEGNILNKWKKNYLRIGKIDEIKDLLEKEWRQDYFIGHLLQNLINPINGKKKFYDYDSVDIEFIK